MDFSRRLALASTLLVVPLVVRGQSTVPALTQALPAQTIGVGGTAVNIDLRNYFSIPGVTGQVAQFDTVLGKFNVELLASAAPLSVANFLTYVGSGAYTNTIIHRSTSLNADGVSNWIVQGGGFDLGANPLATNAPIPLEYNLPNTAGTIAMARTSALNSATSQWFFNVNDNTTVLGPGNGGGYAVFGRVLGTGMSVVSAIAVVPIYNVDNAVFSSLPLQNLVIVPGQTTTIQTANLIVINGITVVPVYPADNTTPAVLAFAVASDSSAVVTATLSGSTLTLAPVGAGTATILVSAADTNGNAVSGSFRVTVTNPTITSQPVAQTISSGSTVVFSVTVTGAPAPTYQWLRGSTEPGAGTPALVPGATGPTLVLSGTVGSNAALAGNYSVVVTNSADAVTSNPAALTVITTNDSGRLTNLSVLSSLDSPGDTFSLGYVVSGASTTNPKPLVIRAAGPSLGALGVPGTLDDPKFELFVGSTKTSENENWGGAAATTTAMAAVGAFAYTSPTSRDAATVANVTSRDNSVKISAGAGTATGTGAVIAEVYDATPAGTFTASTPRLINFSVIKPISAGGYLTLGFTLGGSTAKTVLIRVIGPGLSFVGLNSGTLGDPQLTLYNNKSEVIATNDDWGADSQLSAAGSRVGAFSIGTTATKDAMLLVTLPAGGYTAMATGNGGTSGVAIVEVYEVP